jgi:hypothetical protein
MPLRRWMVLFGIVLTGPVQAQLPTLNQPAAGYQGIWYFIGPTKNEYAYKYSGGLGTYPANHHPFAVYAPAVRKTFFCYGGVPDSSSRALGHYVGSFDHRTRRVSRPVLVLNKKTDDAHDNPVLQIDRAGYLWLFSTSHGTDRPSFIHRSRKPYDLATFDRIDATRLDSAGQQVPFNNFSYFQAHYQPGRGFLALMTHYDRNVLPHDPRKPRRTISFLTSPDGVTWSDWQDVGTVQEGHYQTSAQRGARVASAFNHHPHRTPGAGLDYRTNLYYVETDDFGKTWHAADGTPLTLPLTGTTTPALVHDYAREGRNVYINDVNFDESGHPLLFYLTSAGPDPGPGSGPYRWHLAQWDGRAWQLRDVAESDHNYDMGSLYVEGKTWRIIGPRYPGPQAFGTGGELAVLETRDAGQTWKTRPLTSRSARNHSYPRRPVDAHPDFYAFWTDGHARQPSASMLYFADRRGRVYQLPDRMTTDWERPRRVPRKK